MLAGEVVVSPKVAGALLQSLQGGKDPGRRSPLLLLSPRVLDLFRLVGLGHKPKEIALN